MSSVGFRCSECKIKCPYKESLLKLNKDSSCVTPHQRDMVLEKGGSVRMLNEDTLAYVEQDLLALILEKIQNEENDRTQANWAFRLMELINDTKRSWYPATQKNINANVNLFDEQLKRFNENYVRLQEERAKEKKEIVILTENGVELENADC